MRYPLLIIMVFAAACSSIRTADCINGGFETAADEKNPEGWFANNLQPTKKYAELSVDNSVSHSGSKSIMIFIKDNHPSESTTYNWVRRVYGLEESKVYELEVWMKTAKVKTAPFINVEFWNNDNIIGTASSKQMNIANGGRYWQRIKMIFEVPKSTVKVFVKAGLNSSENRGARVWFDDISINKIRS